MDPHSSASFRRSSSFVRDARAAAQPLFIKNPVLQEHKAREGRRGRLRRGLLCASSRSCVSCLPPPQGVPVREGLQLTYKIVRDKSIKEAAVFCVYFATFLLISYEVLTSLLPCLSLPDLPHSSRYVRSCGMYNWHTLKARR